MVLDILMSLVRFWAVSAYSCSNSTRVHWQWSLLTGVDVAVCTCPDILPIVTSWSTHTGWTLKSTSPVRRAGETLPVMSVPSWGDSWFGYLCNVGALLPSVLWHCWLGGGKGIQPVKNCVMGCWHGYLSGARCRLAYGPADATATHCLLLQ